MPDEDEITDAAIAELNREWQWEPLDDPDGSDWPEDNTSDDVC